MLSDDVVIFGLRRNVRRAVRSDGRTFLPCPMSSRDSPAALAEEDPDDDEDDDDGTEIHLILLSSWCSLPGFLLICASRLADERRDQLGRLAHLGHQEDETEHERDVDEDVLLVAVHDRLLVLLEALSLWLNLQSTITDAYPPW